MRNSNSLKGEFLRKWMKGLAKCNSLSNMSLLERKKAIKRSADLAMASTRRRATRWSQAVLARKKNNVLINTTSFSSSSGLCRSRRILKKSRLVHRVVKKKKMGSSKKVKANCIALRLLKKRRKMLKSLLPGGESMENDVVLIHETLDYIQSLTAQVEVMRCLVNATSHLTSLIHKKS